MDEQVAQALRGTWSADANTRMAAEIRLGELQAQGEAGLSLVRIALHPSAEVPLRQSAALALRRYAKDHWTPASPTFKGHWPDAQTKDQIRNNVLRGLSDPIRRIRSACAFTISEIAHYDWPEEWSTLMPSLIGLLNSNQRDATAGAMVVLADLVRTDLTEDQLIPLAQEMLPMLGRILGDPQSFTPHTRARCVSVFRQCLTSLFMVKAQFPQAVQKVTDDILPQWLGAFENLLRAPLQPELADPGSESWQLLAIRAEIFQTLDSAVVGFPKAFAASAETFTNLALGHLEALSSPYHELYLAEGALPPPADDDEEAGDVQTSLSRLVAMAMSFLSTLSLKAASRRHLYDKSAPSQVGRLQAAMLAVLLYARVTVEDEEKWEDDANAFVVDEDDESAAFGTRSVSEDLLGDLMDQGEGAGIAAFVEAVRIFGARAAQEQASGSPTWWKYPEAALMLSGRFADDLSAPGSPFVFKDVFETLVAPNLSRNDLPYLQGRCFVFSSQWAKHLPPDYVDRIAKYGCDALQQTDVQVVVKLSIVRSLRNFFRHLPNVAVTYAPLVFRHLAALLPQTSDATAILLVETVQAALIATQDTLDVGPLNEIIDLVLAVWRKDLNGTLVLQALDPLLVDAIADLFKTLSTSPSDAVTSVLRQKALPYFASALAEPPISESPFTAPATMVLESIFEGRPSPIGEGLFATFGDALFAVVTRADDASILQSGLDVLSSVIGKDPSQLFQWRSSIDGGSGLDYVVKAIAHVLHPGRSESGGLFVGDLILALLRKAGDLVLPILPDLLKALMDRLALAKSATFTQSMIIPFAYLINSQTDKVLSLLETWTVTTSSGPRNALPVFLEAWCDNADAFQGSWNIRVSTLALTHLFMSARPSLANITVRGERILTAANVDTIMTRSKARANPDQYQAIPFRAKIVKLLVVELQSVAADRAGESGDILGDADDDDGDEDWEDDGGGLSDKTQQDILQLSDMLGPAARHILTEDNDDDDAEDDPDLKDDPLTQIDLYDHLTGFFRHANAVDAHTFRELSDRWLSPEELGVLHASL